MAGQQVGQPVGGLVEFAVGQVLRPAGQRDRVRGGGDLGGEHRRDRGRVGGGWVSTARLPHLSRRVCSAASRASIADSAAVGSVVMAASICGEPPEQCLDVGGVEHVGVVFGAQAQFGAGQGLDGQRVVVVFAVW